MAPEGVTYRENPAVTNEALNLLLADGWADHCARDFEAVLAHSLGYVCAYAGETLIGFVNVAWDGGLHAFILDPTVRSDMRRRGIGKDLVARARDLARMAGAKWLHVDYAPDYRNFYLACGFRETEAGLIDLQE